MRAVSALSQGVSIAVLQGDITVQVADVIVNAANGQLRHGGGIAKALRIAGGPMFELDSARYTREHGVIPVGQVGVTSGGDLRCKWVIHAVGPVWEGGNKNEAELLASAVEHTLDKAEALGASSLIMPVISSGIFGFPKEAASKIVFDRVDVFVGKNPRFLRNIRIIANDDETYAIIERDHNKRYNKKT